MNGDDGIIAGEVKRLLEELMAYKMYMNFFEILYMEGGAAAQLVAPKKEATVVMAVAGGGFDPMQSTSNYSFEYGDAMRF